MIIDSHCHIYDEKLKAFKEEILNNLTYKNQFVICCGDSINTSKQCIELSNNYKNIFSTVGIHPHEADSFDDTSLNILENLAKNNKKVVAIGEIGLDYFYDYSSKENQIKALKNQIILADKLNLPCVFHVRDATNDFLNILKEMSKNYKIKGVVHSFSGSIETANILLGFNLYLGINGIITFKNANKMLEVTKALPLNKILIETDSPYLTPVPFRGQPNRPEFVMLVAKKIAELKDISEEEVIKNTTKNAIDLFNLKL